MITKARKYLQTHFQIIKDSAKDINSSKKKLFLNAAYDIMLYSIIIFILLSWNSFIVAKQAYVDVNVFSINPLEPGKESLFSIGVDSWDSFINIFMVSVIITFIVSVIVASLGKFAIWKSLSNKRIKTTLGFLKLSALNMLWYVFWILLIIILGIVVRQETLPSVLLAIAALMLHFSMIKNLMFTKSLRIVDSFRKTLSNGIQLHKFIGFYAVCFIVFLILSLIFYLPLKMLMVNPGMLGYAIFFYVLFGYAASARIYFKKYMETLKLI